MSLTLFKLIFGQPLSIRSGGDFCSVPGSIQHWCCPGRPGSYLAGKQRWQDSSKNQRTAENKERRGGRVTEKIDNEGRRMWGGAWWFLKFDFRLEAYFCAYGQSQISNQKSNFRCISVSSVISVVKLKNPNRWIKTTEDTESTEGLRLCWAMPFISCKFEIAQPNSGLPHVSPAYGLLWI